MNQNTYFKLAAVAALCVAGYVDAHAQTAFNGVSLGNVSVPTGNCTADYGDGITSIGCSADVTSRYSIEGNPLEDDEGFTAIGSKGMMVHDDRPVGNSNAVTVAAYQKLLARHAATASTLIEDNAEILSPSCLVQVETLQRSLRNAYSSTGGQLPLNEPPFNRHSPEFRGYVAALVDKSEQTSTQIASMVARNCIDLDATSFYRGEVVEQGGLNDKDSPPAITIGQSAR